MRSQIKKKLMIGLHYNWQLNDEKQNQQVLILFSCSKDVTI